MLATASSQHRPDNAMFAGVIWWSLRRKAVLETEIKAIMEMYTNIETSVKVDRIHEIGVI